MTEVTLSPSPIRQDSTQLVPAAELGPERIAALLERAYAGYAVALSFSAALVESLVSVQSVDLDASWVLMRDRGEVGVALVARRGGRERLAAFGIVAEERRRGLGERLGRAVVQAARARGAKRLELEVLARNADAIALYRRLGFSEVERLVGFERAAAGAYSHEAESTEPLATVPMKEVTAAVAEEQDGDTGTLPWQIAPQTILRMPELRGVRVGAAFAAAREMPDGNVTLLALALRRSAPADACALVQRMSESTRGGRLVAPPLFPESRYRRPFESLGFEASELSQLHMTLPLERVR